MIRYKREIKLDFPTGYNISIQPNGSKMIAYIRETIQNDNQGACPLGFNFLHKAILDEDYKVESVFRVNDKSSIPKYTSYTHGVEDCRIINDSLLYGVCLFTNNSWVPELCMCVVENNAIKEMIPMHMRNSRCLTVEKNWLFLKETDDDFIFVHSYVPFRVVAVGKELIDSSYQGRIIHEEPVFTPMGGYQVHGGASLYLADLKCYLLCVRMVEKHVNLCCKWVLLDEHYHVKSTSPHFTFPYHYQYKGCTMILSMALKDENLLVIPVTFGDKDVYIYELDLQEILKTLVIVPKMII